jgi:eukaryotic-like serine/threonine-protein kinase
LPLNISTELAVPFVVDIDKARADFPDFEFVSALTPSEQKAAFHVRRGTDDLCLKIIAPNHSLERAQREVAAMQEIDHSNVVKLIEYVFSSKGGRTTHYMVEEFIRGHDLALDIRPGHCWPIEEIKKVFGELCDGLSELRSRNIVHRDLKPNNIRVRENGSPVIIDFGLARMLDLDSLTQTGMKVGTPLYFSPEQCVGDKHSIDHRTDLYALGAIMFQAATGKHPCHTARTIDDLFQAVCEGVKISNDAEFASLPDGLKMIIIRLLEKERSRRPVNADLVAKLLRGIK